MSSKEVDRYEIIKRSIRKELTAGDASKLIGVSTRHLFRLKAGVKEKGAKALVHGNRDRKSNNKVPEEKREEIAQIIRKHYPDFWPTHTTEHLEDHNIYYSPETIRSIMIEKGIWKSKKRKAINYYSKRPPREYFGEMGILDGSYHLWFEDRNGKCCLLLLIDDATSTILYAKFVESENLKDIYSFTKEYLLLYGKPKTIYTDGLRVYHNNIMEKESEERLTQYKKSLTELDIELIRAYSAEAKGKVETVFGVLQNRLIKEMRLRGISDKEQANKYLIEEFISWYNLKYGKAPARKGNFHRKISEKEKGLLPSILSERSIRVIQNDFCISYKNRTLQLVKEQTATVRKRERVIIEERMDSSIWIKLREKYLNYKEITFKEHSSISSKDIPWIIPAVKKERKSWKPPSDHPWRKFFVPNSDKRHQVSS